MSEIPLNKFEKRDLILRLLKEGKTYREICHFSSPILNRIVFLILHYIDKQLI